METEDVLKLREAREELVSWFKSDPSFRGFNSGQDIVPKLMQFQVKELDFELVAPSLLQHKVISATEYGALSRLPGEEQVGVPYFNFFARLNLVQNKFSS